MKKTIKKIKFKLFKFKNNIYVFFNKKNFKYKVAIISTHMYANKIKDDIYLKDSLNHKSVQTDILCWEDNNNLEVYDAIIIKSIWGYYEQIDKFIKWLNSIKKKNILVLNSVDILKSNMDKEKQYNIFITNGINAIDTVFVNPSDLMETLKEQLKKYKAVIVKPTISESGKNFYKIENNSDINGVYENLKNIKCKLMVQPYLDFNKKEYSILYIEKQIKNIVVKEFGPSNCLINITNINSLPSDIENLSSKVIKCKEYKDSFYGRVDVVYSDKPYIMEAEFLDPSWYIYAIKDKNKFNEALDFISIKIIDRIKNLSKKK